MSRDYAIDRDPVGCAGHVHLAISDRGRYEFGDGRHLVAIGIHVAVPQLVGQVGREEMGGDVCASDLDARGTYTLPSATVGGTNLAMGGIWSRSGFMSLFHNSLARLDASYACRAPGVPAL